MNEIRVRFAPSPTGFLHIGSARTALFNWLYAKNQNGKFLIRIEDTDRKRSKKEYLDEILSSLKWLGMEPGEELFFQSKRIPVYEKYAKKLLDEDKAHYEKTEKGKAIRLKNPKEKIIFNDIVRGKIEFDTKEFADLVLMKSDGTPTYNFACVVDDIEMKITHIIRGEDHISNTPKQIMVYNALGVKPPKFVHIPLILGEDRSRMSKRYGATAIADYKEKGYFPEAIINFLALMGWSPKDNREKLSTEQIIKLFSLKSIKTTPAVFDIKKLDWLNSEYIKAYPAKKAANLIAPFLIKKGLLKKDYDKRWFESVIKAYSTRFSNIDDFIMQAAFCFKEKMDFDQGAVKEHINKDALSYIEKYRERIEKAASFDEKTLEKIARQLAEELGINWARIIHPTRVAVTGRSVSPSIFTVLALLGKERVLKRLKDIQNCPVV
ncbi:MAG: glutamate--tRNA ligase [Candidatus Omnitrophota bacterium]|nr:MAG: glutamate--tRNA ligase [Candidatus Omnitrophota bacterium]